MRHRKTVAKLSRSLAQRRALKRSLLRSLITSERVITTSAKAKELRRWAERLITLSLEDSLHHRRLSYRLLGDHNMVKRLFEVVGPRFKETGGGYTRLLALGYRKGDGSRLSLLELTKREKKDKKTKTKKQKEKASSEEKKEKPPVAKEQKPSRGIAARMKKAFKKGRDAL